MADNATAQETLFALREQIARLEGKTLPAKVAAEQADLARQQEKPAQDDQPRLPFDIEDMDAALDGGLPLNALTEIRSLSMRDAGAASGFVLSISSLLKAQSVKNEPVLWIADGYSAREVGMPYGAGIKQFGLDPQAVFHASPRKLDDALWLAEAALASGVFLSTILEVHGNPKSFGLTESRRLSLRAKAAGRPLFLLRHAGEEEASSASFRLRVEPAPAVERRLPDGSKLGGSIGHPVFQLTLEKSRNPAPLSFILEWNPHDRQFFLARPARRSFDASEGAAHPGAVLPASAHRQDRPQAMGTVVAFERAS
jgi:protein ImuA